MPLPDTLPILERREMCLLIVLAVAVLLLINLFVKSALFLLPWTITAGVLAGLSGIGIGKAVDPKGKGMGDGVCVAASFLLTFAWGYLGWLVMPPTANPQPSNQSLAWLLSLPEPKQAELWSMFPVHLAITGVITGLIAFAIYRRKWPRDAV